LQFSVPEGQKWDFSEFDGKYLKLGCSQRLAVADMFCSAVCWACADIFLEFLQKKLSEIWLIILRLAGNHFLISANLAYFFSN